MVRSKLLWAPATLTGTAQVLYTCPADETGLVKWITVYDTNAAARDVTLSLNGTGSGSIILKKSCAGLYDLQIPVWWPLAPGDDIYGLGASIICSGWGAELEGVAD